jgi:hypothetical protein|tara:strand:+ start:56 stop:277 length:222 start_codon:yes stop_codon:yes gene_type:complete
MKTFSEIRSKTKEGEVVFKKKIKRINVEIIKRPDVKGSSNLPFVAFVDGDRLDSFKSLKDAVKASETIIRELT